MWHTICSTIIKRKVMNPLLSGSGNSIGYHCSNPIWNSFCGDILKQRFVHDSIGGFNNNQFLAVPFQFRNLPSHTNSLNHFLSLPGNCVIICGHHPTGIWGKWRSRGFIGCQLKWQIIMLEDSEHCGVGVPGHMRGIQFGAIRWKFDQSRAMLICFPSRSQMRKWIGQF